MRGGSWSAAPSAGSRTGTETGRTPREGTPHTGEKAWDQHPTTPSLPTNGLEGLRPLLLPAPTPNSPNLVTYQVTKFYSGHGCLEDGPETPKEMRCQSIPEGSRKRGVQSTFGTA